MPFFTLSFVALDDIGIGVNCAISAAAGSIRLVHATDTLESLICYPNNINILINAIKARFGIVIGKITLDMTADALKYEVRVLCEQKVQSNR